MKNRMLLALFASFGLAGCAIIPSDTTPLPSVESQMPAPDVNTPTTQTYSSALLTYAALGQTVSVGGMRVTPFKILEDSRCPANARCVWAGQVRLRIRLHIGSRPQTMEITSGKPLRIADGVMELAEVRPEKMTGRNRGAVAPTAYRFGFGFISAL